MVRFFCSSVIIGMTNYSCSGLYSAMFIVYMQYHASKKLSIDRRNIFLYVLCILYMLSTATILLDVTRYVTVSKICIHRNKISLYTTVWVGPPRTPPHLCVMDNSWLMRLLFSSNLSMHETITISIIYVHSSQL